MACPPGRIQIRRDTIAAWNSTNPVLAAGELGFGYPDATLGYPNGVIRIGRNGGSTWAASIQIFPTSGGGGGTQGATGPQGLSAFQILTYNGFPTITYIPSSLPSVAHGYTIELHTATNDQTICVNPELFNVNILGVVFSCVLPDTASYGGTTVHLGFGSAYGVIGNNSISYYVDGTSVGSSVSYTPGSTLSIVYNGQGSLIFTITNGSSISTYSTIYTTPIDYGYISYQSISSVQTTTLTDANYYTIGVPGFQGFTGPIGPTGPIYTPTTFVTGV